MVDADIARAAGISEHPISSSSRKLLDCLMSNKHSVAMCPALRAEWRKHQSQYSQRWMASMIARKQLKFVNYKKSIYSCIENGNFSDSIKKICLKDVHLVDIALEEDKYIFSKDDTAREKFSYVAIYYQDLRQLIWLNPVNHLNFILSHLAKAEHIAETHYLHPPISDVL